jgi:hypothetical protein
VLGERRLSTGAGFPSSAASTTLFRPVAADGLVESRAGLGIDRLVIRAEAPHVALDVTPARRANVVALYSVTSRRTRRRHEARGDRLIEGELGLAVRRALEDGDRVDR